MSAVVMSAASLAFWSGASGNVNRPLRVAASRSSTWTQMIVTRSVTADWCSGSPLVGLPELPLCLPLHQPLDQSAACSCSARKAAMSITKRYFTSFFSMRS